MTAFEKIKSALAKLVRPDEPLLVGVSGGPDSVALLAALVQLGYRPHVAHLNHQLRGAASDADAEFVRQLAAQSGVPATIAAQRVAPDEDACRQARLAFFARVAAETGLATLALAHTADDQVETFLLRLLRGAGPTGLTGILPDRRLGPLRVIRPLLAVSRAEVLHYLQVQGLQFREDASNADRRFARNRIRHELLPLLEREYNPGIRDILLRTAEILRDEDAFLAGQVAQFQDVETVSVAALTELPVAMQRRALRAWLGDISFADVEAVRHLAAAESPSGAVGELAYRDYDLLRKTDRPVPTPITDHWALKPDGETVIVELAVRFTCHPEHREGASAGTTEILRCAQNDNRKEERFDADALGPAPFARTWQEGDRFQPLGMRGEKKLQDSFVDEKVPRRQRGRVPLLCATDGRIAWVVGYRIAEPFKVTSSTRAILCVRCGPMSPD